MENFELVRGYATLHRRWKSGDVLQLTLDMPVQLMRANVNVAEDKNRVALMRGPMVYCFEGADNGGSVQNLVIPPGTEFSSEYKRNVLGGVTVLIGTATALFQDGTNSMTPMPFKVTAIPYYANANRGTCPMQVWMPETQDLAKPQRQD